MTVQRLYVVRIVREAYVLATDAFHALAAKNDIERWEDHPEVTADLWDGKTILPGWDDGCGVYGFGRYDVSFKLAKETHAASTQRLNNPQP